MTRALRATAVIGAVASVLTTSAASAATVEVDTYSDGELTYGVVVFTGARGEANRVVVGLDERRRAWRFRDSANPVAARGDCVKVDAHVARCPVTEDGAVVRLGDGDDRARGDGVSARLRGGPGDDVLVGTRGLDQLFGGPGDDNLEGGGGDDAIAGGPGRDRLIGGAGNDRFTDGETDATASRDVIVGGPGNEVTDPDTGDQLSYALRHRAVTVALGRGVTTTEDRIIGIESVAGGSGDDRLSGDAGDNLLEGGAGNDLIRGGRGRDVVMGGRGDDRLSGDADGDVLWGEQGRDRLIGGAGADVVISAEERGRRQADRVTCGEGDDLARSDRNDTLEATCEAVQAFVTVSTLPAVTPDGVVFTMRCGISNQPPDCMGTLAVRSADGRPLGRTDFVLANRSVAAVPVRLDAAAIAALRAGTLIEVEVTPSRAYSLNEHSGGYRVFLRAA